jgi:hypothetical protein
MKEELRLQLNAAIVGELRTAEERGMSLSQLVEEQLSLVVSKRRSFDRAKRRPLKLLRVGLDLHWMPSQLRDELHQR